MRPKSTPEQTIARFWSKVDRSGGPDACWEWQAGRRPGGYGSFGVQIDEWRTMALAHRVAWELTNGPIPDGLWVLHRCDNPPCCNPAHLFLGTPKDNTQDAVYKGRMGKLTAGQVIEMRELAAEGLTVYDLAERFRVTPAAVGQIVRGQSYSHIPGALGKRGGQKITEAQAQQIRTMARTMKQTQIARALGLSDASVSRVLHGRK